MTVARFMNCSVSASKVGFPAASQTDFDFIRCLVWQWRDAFATVEPQQSAGVSSVEPRPLLSAVPRVGCASTGPLKLPHAPELYLCVLGLSLSELWKYLHSC